MRNNHEVGNSSLNHPDFNGGHPLYRRRWANDRKGAAHSHKVSCFDGARIEAGTQKLVVAARVWNNRAVAFIDKSILDHDQKLAFHSVVLHFFNSLLADAFRDTVRDMVPVRVM